MISFIFITSSAIIQYNTIGSKYYSILMSDDGLNMYLLPFLSIISITSSATIQFNTIGSKYESILTSDDVSVAFSFYDFIHFYNFICHYSIQHNRK